MCLIKSLKRSIAELYKYLQADWFSLFGVKVEADFASEDRKTEYYLQLLSIGRMIKEQDVVDLLTDYANRYNSFIGCNRDHTEKILDLAASVFSTRHILLPIFSKGEHIYIVKRYLERPILSVYSREKLVLCKWDIQDVQYSDGTLLAKLGEDSYLFVGSSVYEFETLDTGFEWFKGGDQSVLYHKKYAYLLSEWCCCTNSTAFELYSYMEREKRGYPFDMRLYDGFPQTHSLRGGFEPEAKTEPEAKSDEKPENSESKYITIINEDGEEERVRRKPLYRLIINEDGEEERVKVR